jgi:hypothetical protein
MRDARGAACQCARLAEGRAHLLALSFGEEEQAPHAVSAVWERSDLRRRVNDH